MSWLMRCSRSYAAATNPNGCLPERRFCWGLILKHTDTEGLDNADDVPISERTFRRIQESFRELYMNAHSSTGSQ
jgi:hypothetical protein